MSESIDVNNKPKLVLWEDQQTCKLSKVWLKEKRKITLSTRRNYFKYGDF